MTKKFFKLRMIFRYLKAENPILQTLIKSTLYPCKVYVKILGQKNSILDVGCGEGMLASLLQYHFGADVIGIDLDENRIKVAQNANKNLKLKFFCLDFLELHSKTKYDLIVFNDFLHHKVTNNQIMLIQHAKKLLKPNGTILIKDISDLTSADYFLTSNIDKSSYPQDLLSFNSYESWKSIFEQTQMEITAEFYSHGLIPSNNWNCVIRVKND